MILDEIIENNNLDIVNDFDDFIIGCHSIGVDSILVDNGSYKQSKKSNENVFYARKDNKVLNLNYIDRELNTYYIDKLKTHFSVDYVKSEIESISVFKEYLRSEDNLF